MKYRVEFKVPGKSDLYGEIFMVSMGESCQGLAAFGGIIYDGKPKFADWEGKKVTEFEEYARVNGWEIVPIRNP